MQMGVRHIQKARGTGRNRTVASRSRYSLVQAFYIDYYYYLVSMLLLFLLRLPHFRGNNTWEGAQKKLMQALLLVVYLVRISRLQVKPPPPPAGWPFVIVSILRHTVLQQTNTIMMWRTAR